MEDLENLQNIKDIIGKNAKQNTPKFRIKSNTKIILDLDVILDKISAKGIDSLTDSELKFLKNQSKT